MKAELALLAAALQNPPPWLMPHSALLRRILHVANSESVAVALNAARDEGTESLRFVAHSVLPAGEPYESFIASTGCVPTRDNLHDLFNGLMWIAYPQTKKRMNALQAQQIALHGTFGPRGAVRDALTLFDENAAVLHAPSTLVEALRQRDWKVLFIEERSRWQSARLVVFGHALMEKLLQPRKEITAHVWVIQELTDSELASSLIPERLAAKPFLPLPLLGVPGWWDRNEERSFYDDLEVFRPPVFP